MNNTVSNLPSNRWRTFDAKDLKQRVVGDTPKISEFLRAPSMSCAIYHLPAGSQDMQAPHLEDEVYFVLEGQAEIDVGGERKQVGPGAVLYVQAFTEHSFFDITEDLTVIAVFGSQKTM